MSKDATMPLSMKIYTAMLSFNVNVTGPKGDKIRSEIYEALGAQWRSYQELSTTCMKTIVTMKAYEDVVKDAESQFVKACKIAKAPDDSMTFAIVVGSSPIGPKTLSGKFLKEASSLLDEVAYSAFASTLAKFLNEADKNKVGIFWDPKTKKLVGRKG